MLVQRLDSLEQDYYQSRDSLEQDYYQSRVKEEEKQLISELERTVEPWDSHSPGSIRGTSKAYCLWKLHDDHSIIG